MTKSIKFSLIAVYILVAVVVYDSLILLPKKDAITEFLQDNLEPIME